MIIGYYPGAGGNRYYQFLKNLDFTKLGKAYDAVTGNRVRFRELYLDKLPNDYTSGDVLCHSVNYQRIVEAFGPQTVYIIDADLKACLRREWSIKGKYRPMFQEDASNYENFVLELYQAVKDTFWPGISTLAEFYELPDRIKKEVNEQISKNLRYIQNDNIYNFLNSAFEAIAWHKNHYSNFPLDPGQGILVDINLQDTEFSRLMIKELALYEDNILFNFAWDVHQTYGDDAPIINLYEKFVNEHR